MLAVQLESMGLLAKLSATHHESGLQTDPLSVIFNNFLHLLFCHLSDWLWLASARVHRVKSVQGRTPSFLWISSPLSHSSDASMIQRENLFTFLPQLFIKKRLEEQASCRDIYRLNLHRSIHSGYASQALPDALYLPEPQYYKECVGLHLLFNSVPYWQSRSV